MNKDKSYLQMLRELGVGRIVEHREKLGDYRIMVLVPHGFGCNVCIFDEKANTLEAAIEAAWLAVCVPKQNRGS